MRFFSQLHMLVNLEYYSLRGYFGLEIFHICNKHKGVSLQKFHGQKKISSILGRLSKLATMKLFSQLPHVGKSCISSF